jgi:hypothetical protein
MDFKRRIFVTAVLIGTAALLIFGGCGLPGAQQGELSGTAGRATTITKNIQATDTDGFFYSFWKENETGSVSMNVNTGTDGHYTTSWTNNSNFTAGKGWSTGKADRIVTFKGTFNGGSNGYLALYGWAKTNVPVPQNYCVIEYYVIENYGAWTPPGTGTSNEPVVKVGNSYTSDGGTYNIYKGLRKDRYWAANNGTGTFNQYFSVRTSKRSEGKVTFQNHVNAWAATGLTLGAFDYYQIMETEGYQSSGNSSITVGSGEVGMPGPGTPSGFPEKLVALKARYSGKYMSVNGNALLRDDALAPLGPMTHFYLVDIGSGQVALRSESTGNYVCAENDGLAQAVANRTWFREWETFTREDRSGYANFRSSFTSNPRYLRFDGYFGNMAIGPGSLFTIEYLQ